MLRTVSAFYLLSIILAFAIAFWLAANEAHPSRIFVQTMMAWPMAALLMLARKKVGEIRFPH